MPLCWKKTAPPSGSQYPAERILLLPLDVTQPHQVADAFAKAEERFGRIDIVVNNAGIADTGKLEGMEDSKARGLLETNFWGAVSVTKEALKCFRETNPRGIGGRLLKISSYLGLVGLPALPFYCAAKFALEGATEALAAELDPDWNIKATWSPEHPAYSNPALPASHARKVGWDNVVAWKDMRRSAELFYKIASDPNPPLHFVVGKDAIEATRKKITALAADIDLYEAWSNGLEQ
ncbi:NAD(P)-binding protein [Dichomitus squalens LYAD-421 SS1]|uniref:NAD(P)-binding protein n=1 Tax=Dichomitus squalens (strain LYAD-421) TaxID=732165 RepID=R7SP59_DICSQ|nr:NAD(P)-binding protein [Dichomitus squalens LYAD-421 SS1]EJF57886.1 NAD(P)-binding protein [Dichomitus squalens LYAD-421 SS1]